MTTRRASHPLHGLVDLVIAAVKQREDGGADLLQDWLREHPLDKTLAREALRIEMSRMLGLSGTALEAALDQMLPPHPAQHLELDELTHTLKLLMTDPTLTEYPAPLLTRYAWPDRVMLLVADPKAGKSTYACSASAALACGSVWLGERLQEAGTTLYVLFPGEGHVAEVVRTLVSFGGGGNGAAERIHVLHQWPSGHPLDIIERAIRATRPALTTIDSLATFAVHAGSPPESGDAGAWTQLVAPIGGLAQKYHTAITLIHHARRSDGQPRDSSAISACVDGILTMRMVPEDTTLRKISAQSRVPIDPYAIRLDTSGDLHRYQLIDGEPGLSERVLRYVAQHPGASMRATEHGVRGRAEAIRAEVRRLLGTGQLENRGASETAMQIHVA